MERPLQFISGLQEDALGERALTDALIIQAIKIDVYRLQQYEIYTDFPSGSHLLFALPLLGDNDLIVEIAQRVASVVSAGICRGRAVCVVVQGDRHAFDEQVSEDLPFCVKIREILCDVCALTIFPTKLDQYTAEALAKEIADFVSMFNANDVVQLATITQLMSKRPRWQADKRLLDFYDSSTGYSTLKDRCKSMRREVASCVSVLKPRILKMCYADLEDEALADMADALCAEVVDLGSNALSLDVAANLLNHCRWLGMAANGLTHADLSALPSGIETIYLHKNQIRAIEIPAKCAGQFRVVSLYRNKLSSLNWPDDQISIQRLNVGANPLAHLPDSLANASKLSFLGLAKTAIDRLPEWIFQLCSLSELDISYIEHTVPAIQLEKLRHMGVSLITRPGYNLDH